MIPEGRTTCSRHPLLLFDRIFLDVFSALLYSMNDSNHAEDFLVIDTEANILFAHTLQYILEGLKSPFVRVEVKRVLRTVLHTISDTSRIEKQRLAVPSRVVPVARDVLSQIEVVLISADKPLNAAQRDQVRSVIALTDFELAGLLPRNGLHAVRQICLSLIPARTPFSVLCNQPKEVHVFVGDAELSATLPSILAPILTLHGVGCTVYAHYCVDGSYLYDCKKDLSGLVAGGPVDQVTVVPAPDGLFRPSGTVGAIVRIAPTTFGLESTEQTVEEVDYELGFITAAHICTDHAAHVNQLGTVHFSSHPYHDVALVRFHDQSDYVRVHLTPVHFARWNVPGEGGEEMDPDVLQYARDSVPNYHHGFLGDPCEGTQVPLIDVCIIVRCCC
jgi:hypothetical protein